MNITINPDTAWGGNQEIKNYIQAINSRREAYELGTLDENLKQYADELDKNGYCVIRNFLSSEEDLNKINLVKQEFEKTKKENKLQYNNFYTEQAAHPLFTFDSVPVLAFDDRFIGICKHYFQCVPTLNNVSVRKSKASKKSEWELPGAGLTTLYHCDKDSPRFLKFFIYLTDVTDKNGPFTYVAGSHLEKEPNWRTDYRRDASYIEQVYGTERIKKLTGKIGDLVIANTNGWHKGTKVEEGERLLLTIYYNCHPTEWQTTFGGKMKQSDFENLPEDKKPLADFLNKE